MREKRFTMTRVIVPVLALVSTLLFLASHPSQAQTPTQKPKYGGILKMITLGGPAVLGDPTKIRPGIHLTTLYPAIERLVSQDKNGRPIPLLATDWAWAPDGKSVTLNLRKGVKFHDGTDFNAEAVKWNLERSKAARKPGLRIVTSMEVVDAYTIRLNLSRFNNIFLSGLSNFEGMMISPTAFKEKGAEWAIRHPVGTGPFKFVSYKRDVSQKYEKFDGYWDKGKPYLDGIEFVYIADPLVAAASFEAKEGHILSLVSPKEGLSLVKKGFDVLSIPFGGGANLAPDSANPDSPYADKRVREALQYAIDTTALAEALGYGFWEAKISQIIPSRSFANDPNYKGRAYNPDKAKQLLSQAGYPKGFKTTLFVPGIYRNAWVAIQGYLNNVGIKTEIEICDRGRLNSYRFKGWKNGLVWAGMGGGSNTTAMLPSYISKNSIFWVSMRRPEGLQPLINQALSARDFDSQVALTQKVMRVVADDAMFLPLMADTRLYFLHKGVHDTGLAKIDAFLWNPANAWLSQ